MATAEQEPAEPERPRGVGAEAAEIPLEGAVQRAQRERRGQGVQQPEGREAAADEDAGSEEVEPLVPCGLRGVVVVGPPPCLRRQGPHSRHCVGEGPKAPREQQREDQEHETENVRRPDEVVAAADAAVGPASLQGSFDGGEELARG